MRIMYTPSHAKTGLHFQSEKLMHKKHSKHILKTETSHTIGSIAGAILLNIAQLRLPCSCSIYSFLQCISPLFTVGYSSYK